MTTGDKHELDYERTDVEPETVIHAGIGIAILTIAAAVIVLLLFNFLIARAEKADPPNPALARHEQGRKPPEPRLQEMPFTDIQGLRADEKAILEGYGWVDKAGGIAQIPVSEAIKIVAQKGLPQWPAVALASASPDAKAKK